MGEDLLRYIDERIKSLEKELEVLRYLRNIVEARLAPKPPEQKPEEEGLPEALESIGWRRYPSGSGEWCFMDEAPAELVELLERGGGRCVVGGYAYIMKKLGGGKVVISRRLA